MSPHHKWCDIYQESLVAGRNYFRRTVAIFICVLAYVSYTMGVPWWAAIISAIVTWLLIRIGGRIVQDRHYEHAENEWDKTNPKDFVIMGGEEDDVRGESPAADKSGSTPENKQD